MATTDSSTIVGSFVTPVGMTAATGVAVGIGSFLYTNKKMAEVSEAMNKQNATIEKLVAHTKPFSMQPIYKNEKAVEELKARHEEAKRNRDEIFLSIGSLNQSIQAMHAQMMEQAAIQNALIAYLQSKDDDFSLQISKGDSQMYSGMAPPQHAQQYAPMGQQRTIHYHTQAPQNRIIPSSLPTSQSHMIARPGSNPKTQTGYIPQPSHFTNPVVASQPSHVIVEATQESQFVPSSPLSSGGTDDPAAAADLIASMAMAE